MTMTMKAFGFSIALLLLNSSGALAKGEQSSNSTGDYAMDLGQVHGAAESIKHMGEICSEGFPRNAEKYTQAYRDWRKNYLPFLQEIERHWLALGWKAADNNHAEHSEFLESSRKAMAQYKAGLKANMTAEGGEAFEGHCNNFRTYTLSDRANLEHFYAEQVKFIRSQAGR